MVATESNMQVLGSNLPNFNLPDVTRSSQLISNKDFRAQPVLVMFICNHCPYVIHIIASLTHLANKLRQRGVAVVAISSNDRAAYPQDGPERMVEFAKQHGFEFPYCYDESQQVAINFGAACTPDFFVYDRQHRLRYRGQMDGARPGNGVPVSGDDLSGAVSAVLSGADVAEQQIPSVGCSIKWKLGNQSRSD